jgi:malate dehydrogenase
MAKVSVIGAGSVGATLAQRVLESGIADVVLVDILKNLAVGKALDMLDASPVVGHERTITGTDDYSNIRSSEIVVITAGLPRKPGMTREELISKNAAIVKSVAENIKRFSPGAVVIVVTNPLDVMTYHALKVTGFDRGKVMGMAGILDGSRMAYLIAEELKVSRSSVETIVLGSHGDTMVPLISHTKVSGKPIISMMSENRLKTIIDRTRDRGAEIVGLFGTGSAFYSPSAGALEMIRSVFGDTGKMLAVSAYLDGEYGLRDVCIGVPCLIGKEGIKKVLELDISEEESLAFKNSAKAIKSTIALL